MPLREQSGLCPLQLTVTEIVSGFKFLDTYGTTSALNVSYSSKYNIHRYFWLKKFE